MTFLKKVFGHNNNNGGGESGEKKVKSQDNDNGNGDITSTTNAPKNLKPTTNSETPFKAPVDVIPLPSTKSKQYQFSDFEVQRTLGTGSFGRVFLVVHKPTGQFFAMKKLRKSDVIRLKQVEHTNNERYLLLQVDYPFIVRMICTFQDERHLFIVLEYVCGGELFSLLRKVRVPFYNQSECFILILIFF